MSASALPPVGNTAGISTRGEGAMPGVMSIIDYLAGTVPEEVGIGFLKAAIAGDGEWEDAGHGTKFYDHMIRWGEWAIMWGRTQGIHFEGSGKAIRQLEEREGFDWLRFFGELGSIACHYTRVDWAWDFTNAIISLPEVIASVKGKRVVTRAKHRQVDDSWRAGAEDKNGVTVYIGRGSSERMVRIYDKARQLRQDGSWVRVELQCRGRWANESIEQFMAGIIAGRKAEAGVEAPDWAFWIADTGLAVSPDAKAPAGAALAARGAVSEGFQRVSGILKGYLSFHTPPKGSNDHQVWRWPLADWWERVVGAVEVCGHVPSKVARSIDQKLDWVVKQVMPTLAAVFAYMGGDMDWLKGELRQGQARWNLNQRAALVAAGMGYLFEPGPVADPTG